MPRPNRPRTNVDSTALARRIASEREKRRWSYEGLASRMEQVGCPMSASAIYKIEKGQPPRVIQAAEFIAFADVFELDMYDMLRPLEVVAHEGLEALWDQYREAWFEWRDAVHNLREAELSLERHVQDFPEIGDALKALREREGMSVDG